MTFSIFFYPSASVYVNTKTKTKSKIDNFENVVPFCTTVVVNPGIHRFHVSIAHAYFFARNCLVGKQNKKSLVSVRKALENRLRLSLFEEKIMSKQNKPRPSASRSRSRTCAVVNCPNGDYRFSKWEEEQCVEHNMLYKHCPCEPIFQ